MGKNVDHPAEQMITLVRAGAEYARLTLRGHLDHHAVQQLRAHLAAALDSGARYVTVDLSGADGCLGVDGCFGADGGDENVFDILGWAERRASLRQGWLALVGSRRCIRFVVP